MTFHRINPEELGPPSGWTNGMLATGAGRMLFVAGQDATLPGGEVASDDIVEQFDAALAKTLAVVDEAGGGAHDIGRMTVYVTDLEAYWASRKEIGEVYRARMGRHFPAMSLVEVSRLVDPRGKVEIEATVILLDSAGESSESAT